ncbi:penicillin-binding protein activator [Yoonia sp. BS5-3]|uniref:Penicillin-binding protein activator n=1 Tax=Yoonia phaeophyticola TaxID=3137369 RepID=A0ABZ2V2Z5_9RHOB
MFARFQNARKPMAHLFAFLSLAWLAACDITVDPNANVGPEIDPDDPVQVALLVPGGSLQSNDNLIAQDLENAARLAIADLEGAKIELRVYNTAGGDPTQAAASAAQAANEGAQIIIGPLYGEAANAAGVAVANDNINVLAFSNTTTIAGGNVFVLGTTFDNTARRLVSYATRQGINRYSIVHAQNDGGTVGRDAIASAVQAYGAELVAVESYGLSQQSIFSSTRRIVSAIRNSGAQSVFMTATGNADLPIIATALPDAGLNNDTIRFIGLSRWDSLPQLADLPGLDGGLFAMPERSTTTLFENRYAATYGSRPHPVAGLAYDGIAAIGALVASGSDQALTKDALTTPQGFSGTSGPFRLLPNGLNERALAIATIQDKQVVILDSAPRSFGSPGL